MNESLDDIADGSAETYMEGFADGSKDARDKAKMDWACVGWPRIDLGWFHDKQFRQDLGFCELNED